MLHPDFNAEFWKKEHQKNVLKLIALFHCRATFSHFWEHVEPSSVYWCMSDHWTLILRCKSFFITAFPQVETKGPVIIHLAYTCLSLLFPENSQSTHFLEKMGLFFEVFYIIVCKVFVLADRRLEYALWRKCPVHTSSIKLKDIGPPNILSPCYAVDKNAETIFFSQKVSLFSMV